MNDAPVIKEQNNSDNDDDNNLLNLLGDSNDDGGMVVNGAEESFDFNPPGAVVATKGFDAEFSTADKGGAAKKVIAQPP